MLKTIGRKIWTYGLAGLFLFGLVQLGGALSVPAKAWLSVKLINNAWAHTREGDVTKPWPWMDSAPVAKLSIPHLDKEFVVMRGVSGNVLAFTPGWHEGTAYPGQPGISLISAHRDTHFSFLRHLNKGDTVVMETTGAENITYIIEEISVLHGTEIKVPSDEDESVLLLSTCFPYMNGNFQGEMRVVVTAKALTREKTDYLS